MENNMESRKRTISEEIESEKRRKRKSKPRKIDGDEMIRIKVEDDEGGDCLLDTRAAFVVGDDAAGPHFFQMLPENSEDDEPEADEDEEEDKVDDDPHKLHFEYQLPETVVNDYNTLYQNEIEMEWPELKTVYVTGQESEGVPVAVPLTLKSDLADFHLKENLLKTCRSTMPAFSPLQLEVLSVLTSYYDLVFCNRTLQNGDELRTVYCLHIVNHILKARAKIIHHNAKLNKNPDLEFKDQGFTRPTVLVLAPFREDCLRIVRKISSSMPDAVVMNKSRFEKEYGCSEPPRQRMRPKPDDYVATFSGNTNEDFKIGLKIKNKSICLYSEFYSSDLLIASPLGLRQVIGGEGDKDRDFDFLSSLEVVIIDRADVLLMQNWYHLIHVMNHINMLPNQPRSCNFLRVRTYALDQLARFYRQTVLFSDVEHGWFKSLFSHGQCVNHAGYVRTWHVVETPSICRVAVPAPQVFRRFETELPVTDVDDRFNFFTREVLPQFKEPEMSGTLIYVPSYFDFVRLRNYFRDNELSCAMVCEYTKSGKVAQARDLFFHGYRHFMLYTERAHFYNRFRIKGASHVIFYQMPIFLHFYEEICNFLLLSNPKNNLTENTCTVVLSKYDCLQLKYIAGMSKAKHILSSEKNVFMVKTQDDPGSSSTTEGVAST